ncbi:hypothetical protein HNR46_000582 [Haloferula luteola]|uniref:Pyridoxal phosphate homeostasis protein n=1 Tax=Haloferula luteola TaxID=595692 RepID=A0A840V6F6_9BACT|nr:YggS family pyridoxal phosphate-dependent enzyme [Haloferula luteola]MBB5350358.1 hypothetical protein [Haloferula luteola]
MDRACDQGGRARDEVQLLAVSKTFGWESIQEAYQAGQRSFGESRQQEAEAKIRELPSDIEWHFIGTLQRNKVRKVLEAFSVIHSVSSLRLARHIDRIADEMGVRPKVFLEINIAGEISKGGFPIKTLHGEFAELMALEHLQWQGLMAIPPEEASSAMAAKWFRQVRELRDELQESSGHALPELSMGMSGDYEVAIAEGATLVRVGSAIFGDRFYPA